MIEEPARPPTPNDIAELGGTFAMTAEVLDPEVPEPEETREDPPGSPTGSAPGSPTGSAPGSPTGSAPGSPTGSAPGSPTGSAAGEADDERPAGDDVASPERTGDDPQTERGLRGLVGGGSSQVSVGAAMRARDAARPTDADLAAAEHDLIIVRRGWVPREDLPPRVPRR